MFYDCKMLDCIFSKHCVNCNLNNSYSCFKCIVCLPVSFHAKCMSSVWINFVVIILGSFAHTFAQDMFMTSNISLHLIISIFRWDARLYDITYGHFERACCPSVPILLPTSHPLNSSLDKEGSLFLMDSICFFPILTVRNMETPPLISLFTVTPPPHSSTPRKLSIVRYHISLNASLRVRRSRCRFFCYHPTCCFSEGS